MGPADARPGRCDPSSRAQRVAGRGGWPQAGRVGVSPQTPMQRWFPIRPPPVTSIARCATLPAARFARPGEGWGGGKLGLSAGEDVDVTAADGRTIAIAKAEQDHEKPDRLQRALANIRNRNWTLPPDYKFDRDEANER